jgi:hypothetical protein
LQQFIEYYTKKLNPTDIKFLNRTADVEDPYPKSYLTAKIHKKPWKLQPIVSVSGSSLDGLGRWFDMILQPFFKATTSAILSSTTLKHTLMTMDTLPPTARFFTSNAVSIH